MRAGLAWAARRVEGSVVVKSRVAGIAGLVVAGALTAGPAAAQGAGAVEAELIKTRQRISMMEGVLERAVSNGAENTLRQLRTMMPEIPMLTGAPHARGFKLDGYGVFFDVEVPGLRLPLMWSLRYVVDDNRLAMSTALAELRTMLAQQAVADRERLDMIVQRLEASVVPPASTRPAAQSVVDDPNDAYTRAVKEALVDAMIENSGPMTIAETEWLTVAASDNGPRDPLVPTERAELPTVVFRIKGADLAAFRSGRATLEETRARIEVSEH